MTMIVYQASYENSADCRSHVMIKVLITEKDSQAYNHKHNTMSGELTCLVMDHSTQSSTWDIQTATQEPKMHPVKCAQNNTQAV